jgi:hypothetical protein
MSEEINNLEKVIYTQIVRWSLICLFNVLVYADVVAQHNVSIFPVDSGWAKNSVNTVVFRKNSLTTWKDTQYISYYDKDGYVVVGKRNIYEPTWTTHKTRYKGNVQDAHNSISIVTDGKGYLHLSWDHHNTSLKYARSIEPGSFEFATMSMTGVEEERVSYPEFYRLPNGNLIFLYRSGESGKGKLLLNAYDVQQQTWKRLQNNLIDGEDQRNAYWQCYVDHSGTIHISWVWRETADVASNHDMCYARSRDAGLTWTTSSGQSYQLPITAATAEYVLKIKQNSELINQTSMSADEAGVPYIATYWRENSEKVPQYHILYRDPKGWKDINTDFRKTAFSLSGVGTKSIPVSRPQIVVKGKGKAANIFLIFRDAERTNKVSVYQHSLNSEKNKIYDLHEADMGSWEPSYDHDRWKSTGMLGLFIQPVRQADGEGMTGNSAQMVSVLEWTP